MPRERLPKSKYCEFVNFLVFKCSDKTDLKFETKKHAKKQTHPISSSFLRSDRLSLRMDTTSWFLWMRAALRSASEQMTCASSKCLKHDKLLSVQIQN